MRANYVPGAALPSPFSRSVENLASLVVPGNRDCDHARPHVGTDHSAYLLQSDLAVCQLFTESLLQMRCQLGAPIRGLQMGHTHGDGCIISRLNGQFPPTEPAPATPYEPARVAPPSHPGSSGSVSWPMPAQPGLLLC